MLQPSTSIWVSSSDHFLRGFFCWMMNAAGVSRWSTSPAILRIFPLRSGIGLEVSAIWDVRSVSSRKFHAGTSLGEEGRARDTRLCFSAEDDVDNASELEDDTAGKGAVKENVTAVGGLQVESADSDMTEARQRQNLD